MTIQNILLAPALAAGVLAVAPAAMAATPNPTANLNVTLKVNATCSISAATLAFGTQNGLSSQVDQQGDISLTCTSGTTYKIRFNNGANAADGTQQRRMRKGTSSDYVNYQIYKDAARSTILGIADGTNTIDGSGAGTASTETVYGRIPAQPTAAVGNYADTVQMTVSY